MDHDHVLTDVRDRFEMVLEALESDPDLVFNRAVRGKLILGSLGDIEVGVRQLIRAHPVEFEDVTLEGGDVVRVPTIEETLRIKAYLTVKRNQVRDYLDVAALADAMSPLRAAQTLSRIDDYYADQSVDGEPVRSQLTRQLGNPRPQDTHTISNLSSYKGLVPRWHRWSDVVDVCREIASHLINEEPHQNQESPKMSLAFRNIDVDPASSVEQWGFEGLLAAVDRGEASDWWRISEAVRRDPWGPVARLLEGEVFAAAEDSGVVGALRGVIVLHRARAERAERDEVADQLRTLLDHSGLTQGEFASRMGTSRSRLSTYLSGKVVPSAALVVRARRVAGQGQTLDPLSQGSRGSRGMSKTR